jgi:hypothetical protein
MTVSRARSASRFTDAPLNFCREAGLPIEAMVAHADSDEVARAFRDDVA